MVKLYTIYDKKSKISKIMVKSKHIHSLLRLCEIKEVYCPNSDTEENINDRSVTLECKNKNENENDRSVNDDHK